MKKKLIILGLLIPLFLVGCGTDGESSVNPGSSSNDSSETSNSESSSSTDSSSSETTIAVKSVKLNRSTLDVYTDDTEASLVATISPEDATNKEVTWSSSKTSVATVDNEGKITPVGVGTTTIKVTTVDGKKTASCTLNIKQFVNIPNYVIHILRSGETEWEDEEILLNPATTSEYYIQGFHLNANDVFKIHMYGDTWYGYSALKTSCPSGLVTAASSDDNIKVLSSGDYDIYSAYNMSDSGHIYLAKQTTPTPGTVHVTDIELDRSAKYLLPRYEFQLKATVYPSNASDKTVFWTSSDTSIATVTSAGRVIGAASGKKGSTVITATTMDGSYKATCLVYVSAQSEPDYYLTGRIGGYSYSRGNYKYAAVPMGDGTYIISDVQLVAGDEISVYSYKDMGSLKDKSYKTYVYNVKETMYAHIYLKPKDANFNYLTFVNKNHE